jgi:hypothetical protein
MEGDIVDISTYNETDTHNRIDAFMEALEVVKKGEVNDRIAQAKGRL